MGMPGPEYSTPKHIAKRACSGLVATYEVWNLRNDRYPICHFDIPLDDSEVLIHVQHVFKDPHEIGPLRFLTAINTNIHIFAILRTIYSLHGPWVQF